MQKPPLLVRYRLAGIEKSEAYFLKEAKAAALQLRSPPAGEAKATNLKDEANITEALRVVYLILNKNLKSFRVNKHLSANR